MILWKEQLNLYTSCHGSLTKDGKKSELLLQRVQEYRRLYTADCKKETLNKRFLWIKIHNKILMKL